MDLVRGTGRKDVEENGLLCPPVDFLELELEWFHTFDSFFDGNLLGHSARVLRGNRCAVRISNSSAAMIERRPEYVAVCLALNSTGKRLRTQTEWYMGMS